MSRGCAVGLAIALIGTWPAASRADVLIKETIHVEARGKTTDGARSTSVKGRQMRLESAVGDEATVTVYDLQAGQTLALDAKKRRAEIRDIAARAAQLQKKYPREQTEVAVKATGVSKSIAGVSCDEHTFTVRVPLLKDGSVALLMQGSAWVAMAAPGVDEYAAFATSAIEHDLVLGVASGNVLMLALNRAQTELYRALSGLHGIPFLVDLTTAVDGHGVIASLAGKVMTATRITTVTDVIVGPVPDDSFRIPARWKQEKK